MEDASSRAWWATSSGRQSFLVMIGGGAAGGGLVLTLVRGQLLSAGVCACALLYAVSMTKPEPTNTLQDHVRRALRFAGLLAGICTLFAAASFAMPVNKGINPIGPILLAAIVGAVFGAGSYVLMTALRMGWDAAIARMRHEQ